jgi:hypothetical protein
MIPYPQNIPEISINPEMASRDDIARMAADLMDFREAIQYAIGGCDAFMNYEHCSKESKGDFEAIKKTLEKALKD